MQSHIKPLTSLRFFAAMMVVVLHVKDEFGSAFNLNDISLMFDAGGIGVDFFFLLSAFILSHVHRADFLDSPWPQYKRFLLLRLARIYPLHLVILLLWLVAFSLVPLIAGGLVTPQDGMAEKHSAESFFTNLLLIHAWGFHDIETWNHPSWSISSEWFAYLLFPVMIALWYRIANWRLRVLAAVLAYAGSAALYVAADAYDLLLTVHYGNLRIFFLFVMGVGLYDLFSWLRENGRRLPAADAVAWAAIAVTLVLMHLDASMALLVPVLAVLLLAAADARRSFHTVFSWSPLVYLGEVSYAIYMVHALVEKVWEFIYRKWLGDGFFTFETATLALLGLMAACTIGGMVLYHVVELPARRFLRRRVIERAAPLRPEAAE
ncbi:acyltransferase family protein [Novispirillum sp. DQ9]|uniref:acyltransferase family protein n=1 Tax=Novispirillum sp. DQ9 TaxID=3398612 RepID=UPI003C7B45B2